MKFASRDDRSAGSARRLTLALAVAALLPILLYASVPAWWTQRGVLVENATSDDFAPANQGQLKNIAKAAAAAPAAGASNLFVFRAGYVIAHRRLPEPNLYGSPPEIDLGLITLKTR